MNFRLTAILFGVLLLLISGLFIATLTDDTPSADQILLEPLAGQKADDIELIEYTRTEPSEEKVVFAKVGKDRWELREGSSGKLDAGAITRLIETLLKLKPTLTKDLTGNPAAHGLEKPSLKVTLRTAKQQSGTLLVGDTTLGAEKAITFVATGERPGTPIAVKRSDIAALFRDGTKDGKAWQIAKWVPDYRQRRLLGSGMMDVVGQAKAIRITVGGKELAMSRAGTEWKFDAPPGLGYVDLAGDPATKPDVITGLRALTVTITSLIATGVDDFIENPEAPEKYGLAANDPNLIRIEITPPEGPPEVLLVGKVVEGSAPVKRYAQVPGEKVVLKLFGDRIEALVKTVNEPKVLQDRTLVKELDATRIDAVDSTVAGVTAKMRKVPVGPMPVWVLYGASEPQPASPVIMTLLMELAKPRVALEALAAPDAFFAPPELKAELKLWLDGFATKVESKDSEIPAEPALKGAANMTFLFGKVEGDIGYVRRTLADGTKLDFKVPASLTAQANKKRGDYYDLKFKEFLTGTAKKLTFNRGAEIFEIAKSETPDADYPSGKWTFLAPASLKDQIAETDRIGGTSLPAGGTSLGGGLIGTLATLSAASVVNEAPTEAELKAMGLDPAAPRVKITVALNDEKDKERVYLFGTETADKAYVHFKLPNKPAVYLVPKVALDPFLTSDLRERLAYKFDITDVKKITLSGWRKKNGSIVTLELEKQGETWIAKATPPFDINQQGVALLLAHLRAPKPLAVLGPKQEAVHGFDAAVPANDPLVVVFSGDKGEIVRLNIGNEAEGGTSFFAWISKTNEIVTLPAGLYRQFKESGAEFFKK